MRSRRAWRRSHFRSAARAAQCPPPRSPARAHAPRPAGTNRGPAFTKGTDDPSEVKVALIDRAVVQFVRTLGTKSRSDQEFEENLQRPAVQKLLPAFRILTCLMGLLKLLVFLT